MAFNPEKHHRRSIRLKGYDYSMAGAYFVTMCVSNRQRLFGNVIDGKMILNEAGRMVETIWMQLAIRFEFIELDEFTVMPNHFHGILVLSGRCESCIRPGSDESCIRTDSDESCIRTGRCESCIRPVSDESCIRTDSDESCIRTGRGESCIRPVSDESCIRTDSDESCIRTGRGESCIRPGSDESCIRTDSDESCIRTGRGESCIRPVSDESCIRTDSDESCIRTGRGESCIRPVSDESCIRTDSDESCIRTGRGESCIRPVSDESCIRTDSDESCICTGRGESCIRPSTVSGDHKDRPDGTLPGTVGRVIQAFKSISTHEYINGVKHKNWTPFPGKLWQRNYYEHIIRDDESLKRIRAYIINNPLQWAYDRENSAGALLATPNDDAVPNVDELWHV